MDGLDGTDGLEQIDGWGIPLPKSCITYFILFLFYHFFSISLAHTDDVTFSVNITFHSFLPLASPKLYYQQ